MIRMTRWGETPIRLSPHDDDSPVGRAFAADVVATVRGCGEATHTDILRHLRGSLGYSKIGAAHYWSLNDNDLHRFLRELVADGQLERHERPRGTYYTAVDELRAAVSRARREGQ